jgi:hypothetical protein
MCSALAHVRFVPIADINSLSAKLIEHDRDPALAARSAFTVIFYSNRSIHPEMMLELATVDHCETTTDSRNHSPREAEAWTKACPPKCRYGDDIQGAGASLAEAWTKIWLRLDAPSSVRNG